MTSRAWFGLIILASVFMLGFAFGLLAGNYTIVPR